MAHTSAEPLGTDFAHGWRKLPDELRIEVLKHNLVVDKPIRYRMNPGRQSYKSTTRDGDFDHGADLRHHLALGPEIANLALQVFYEKNTMEITQNYEDPVFMPPPRVRQYIVHLTWEFFRIDTTWPLLSELATNDLGFCRLQHLKLKLVMHRQQFYSHVWLCCCGIGTPAASIIVFKCKGIIEVAPDALENRGPGYVPSEEIETWIREKIVFAK